MDIFENPCAMEFGDGDFEECDCECEDEFPEETICICDAFELFEEKDFVAASYRRYKLTATYECLEDNQFHLFAAYQALINRLMRRALDSNRGKTIYMDTGVSFSNGHRVDTGLTKVAKEVPSSIFGQLKNLPESYFLEQIELFVLYIFESDCDKDDRDYFPLDGYVSRLRDSVKTNRKASLLKHVEDAEMWLKEKFVMQQRSQMERVHHWKMIGQIERINKSVPDKKKLRIRVPFVNQFGMKEQCKGELSKDCTCGTLHVSDYANVAKISSHDLGGMRCKQYIITVKEEFLKMTTDKLRLYSMLANNLALSELDAEVSINTMTYFAFFDVTGCCPAKDFGISYVHIRPEVLVDVLTMEPFFEKIQKGRFLLQLITVEPKLSADFDRRSEKTHRGIAVMLPELKEYLAEEEHNAKTIIKNPTLNENVVESSRNKAVTTKSTTEDKDSTEYTKECIPSSSSNESTKSSESENQLFSSMQETFKEMQMAQEMQNDESDGYSILSITNKLITPKSKICAFSISLDKDFKTPMFDMQSSIAYICYKIIRENGQSFPARQKKRISIRLRLKGQIYEATTCDEPDWSVFVLQRSLFSDDWDEKVKEFYLEIEYRLLN